MGYPGASSTYSLLRKVSAHDNTGNPLPPTMQTLYTGVSLRIRSLNAMVDKTEAAEEQVGVYRGMCYKTQDIKAFDRLQDEVNLEVNGKPVTYEVQSTFVEVTHIKLELYRTSL